MTGSEQKTGDSPSEAIPPLVAEALELAESLTQRTPASEEASAETLEDLRRANQRVQEIAGQLKTLAPKDTEEAEACKAVLAFAAFLNNAACSGAPAAKPTACTESATTTGQNPTDPDAAVNTREASNPPPSWPAAGEHLITPRPLYHHHGLSLGDGRVINRTGPGMAPTDGTVCILSLEDFAEGNSFWVHPHANRRFSAAESIERALSKNGEIAYNVAFNNCEHFVNWCIDGEHRSAQVDRLIDASTSIASSLLRAVSHRADTEPPLQQGAPNVVILEPSGATGGNSSSLSAAAPAILEGLSTLLKTVGGHLYTGPNKR